MTRRATLTCGLGVVLALAPLPARADVPINASNSPVAAPAPSSQGSATTVNGQFLTGAGGVLEPIPPSTITQGNTSSFRSAATTPSTPPPTPCSPGAAAQPAPGSFAHKLNYTIYPTFTRNASGGYTGSDPAYGYYQPNAIPSGGDPTQVQLGAPATAANIAGHAIGVPVAFNGVVQNSGGSGACSLGGATFGTPFLARDNPPAPPAANVLADPPFALGNALVAQVTGSWRLGTIDTLPGPDGTASTFVHIPTCAWLDSNVPLQPTSLHAIKTAQSDGYTLFLVYNITVTPQPITWDWGDGTQDTSLAALESPPPTLPSYNASTQLWTNPCSVSHAYGAVSIGRTITATQSFTVTITVSWSDGVETTTDPVPCNATTQGACTIAIGPTQGWISGPHPVDQIEPVPFNPPTGG